ncbi:MAG: hypothetical protein JSV21_05540 [Nitrospirota bacterium]|nr:MAG: hypothetical protein JSV21_05540 [Nitrospirota bacterium]
MKDNFGSIIMHLIGMDGPGLAKIDISGMDISDRSKDAVIKNLNSSFLISLAGSAHPLYNSAVDYLRTPLNEEELENTRVFLNYGIDLILREIANESSEDPEFTSAIEDLAEFLNNEKSASDRAESVERIRGVFFPEGSDICQYRQEKISELRTRRMIRVTGLNEEPICEPDKEVLFTSNILITTPSSKEDIPGLDLSEELKRKLSDIMNEDQQFWFDHPIQVGVETEKNEAIYGMRALDEAVEFERSKGLLSENARISCVLSASATHNGLQSLIKEYLEEEFGKVKKIRNIDIFIFSESDTRSLLDKVMIPAVNIFMDTRNSDLLYDIFGVDGEYGRHYSFLKAVSALWHVLVDPSIKGTFKIDLDQVFPQDVLYEETALPAFQHFKSPLWGAKGEDANGEKIELGMIAGALVNEKDISESLFFPDVCFPPEEIKADELVFQSSLPQALSTEAEMMTRYDVGSCNGRDHCIQRIHVTGGTCGILVDHLRKYRPFTPTFIGRAEDQAYLLSVLFNDTGPHLRYVHKAGLIMRHDKEAFAQEAIKRAYLGKIIGDYARILWFSYYVRALPWPRARVKELIDPFTGCFVSHIPFTVVYLRLALKAAALLGSDRSEEVDQGINLIKLGTARLFDMIKRLDTRTNPIIKMLEQEREGWNLYYDILDKLENALANENRVAMDLRRKGLEIIEKCKLRL